MKHIENEAKGIRLKKLWVIYVFEKASLVKNFYTKLSHESKDAATLPWAGEAHIYEKTLP
jgi:hypothetical protein